ncbi:MAG: hypothetical protein GF411_15755 [Candidatus Lokiarchaeota archaeon]|nr:hypothetical protein [Candidatus Lokiarchaeota archaeon]
MANEQTQNGSLSIIALESGIEYHDIDNIPDEPLFIHMIGIRPYDLGRISQKFEIDLEDLQDLQDPDERPRLQIEDKFTMLVLRVPMNLEIGGREYSTQPIGLFTNGRDIVLLQNEEIPLRKQRLKRKLKQCTTPSTIIYNVWEQVIHSFEHTLDMIEATINSVEDSIMSELYPSEMELFFQLSRDAVFMEAALKANMRVLRRLKRVHSVGRMILDEDRLDELRVDLAQQMELSAIYRDLIENAMNAYDSIVNHNLNRVMKTLTSVSLLVSVPTLVASIYGMNVNLPFQNQNEAFIMIILISLAITIPLLIFLRSKNLV